MRNRIWVFTLASLVLGAGAALAADAAGRLYGKITTTDGDTYEGLIRWDNNEASWPDILDGTKEREESPAARPKRGKRTRTSIEVLGIKIGDVDNEVLDGVNTSQCGIRMGQLKSIEPDGDDAAFVTFKSGRRIRMSADGSDLGSGIRQILIEDNREGETELAWEDLEKVEFMPAKAGIESSLGDRLYGTVSTRRGDQYSGVIAWDADEAFGTDMLDGEAKDRTRKIRFDKIAAIERYSSEGASVTLKSGETIVLRGTNDVDSENRGIVVSDPTLGQVVVPWEEFDKLEFKTAPPQITYDQFDGGRPLHGTVYSEEGDTYTGTIRWDDDEEYTWEMLNGEFHGSTFEIEMGLVARIEKQSSSASMVTLLDGRSVRLRGSNDVDDGNRGVFIKLDSGRTVEVDWTDFQKVEFSYK
jgi:hypothetical protein